MSKRRAHCGCTNHLNGPKQMYPDQEAAIDAILDRHISHGAHEIYPCPHHEGVLHVRSIRPAYTRRRTA